MDSSNDPEARTLDDFAANLRLVCERSASISQVCRRIGINRQQFNKYLSGRHAPSATNVRVIAKHFGLARDVLFARHEHFRTLVDGNFFETFNHLRQQPQVLRFLDSITLSSRTDGEDLVGVYDRYHYSSIYARRILRSVLCIYRNGDFLNHTYVERFPSYDNPLKTQYVFKYHGFTLPVAGRVFTVDFESVQRNELTFGIYSAVQRNSKRFVFGITTGVAATMFRQPFATRIVLHHRHAGLLGRDDVRRATALDMNDPSIPREAREFLGDGPDMIKPG